MRSLMAVALGFLLAVPAAADDRGTLQAFLEDSLSGVGREVRIEGFRGALSSQARLDRLTIADGAGVWLTMEGVALDWTRSALFSGRLEITALTADLIVLDRLPEAAPGDLPEAEAPGFALPELPVSVRIGRIAAPRIELAAPVLGQAVTAGVEASAMLAGGEGQASLTLQRSDLGPKGRLSLSASYANASGQLVLDLLAEEDAGGLAATLLGLPGRPATRLEVRGFGPPSAFAAQVRLSTDGTERLAGTLRLGPAAEGGTAFSADLGGNPAPLFLPDYADFFGNDLRLTAEGERTADGRLDLSAVRLRARTLDLSGHLTLGADGLPERFALDMRLADPAGAPVLLPLYGAATRVDRASLRLAYDRPSGEGWRLSGEMTGLDREDLRAARVTLTGSGRIARQPVGRAAVGGTLRLQAEGIAQRDPAAAAALGDAIAAEAVFSWLQGSGALRLGRGVLTGADYGLTLAGTVEGLGSGFRLDGRSTLRADDLSRFAALAGRPLAGALTIEVAGRGSPLGGDFDLEATAEGRDLALGQPQADGLLRGASLLVLSAARGPEGIDLRRLDIAAGGGTVTARGRISSAGSDLSARLDLPDLSVLGAGWGGALAGTATVNGTVSDMQVTLEGEGRALSAGIPQIDRLLRGRARVALEARRAGDVVTLSRAEAEGAAGRLALSGRFDPAGHDLRATAALSDLAALVPGWTGTLEADATLTGPEGAERLALSGRGRDLGIGNADLDRLLRGETTFAAELLRDGGRVTIRSARADNPQVTLSAGGTAEGAARRISVEGRLKDLGLILPGLPGALTLAGRVDEDAAGYGLDLRLAGPGRIAATVAGRVAPGFDRADLRIAGTAAAALANPFLGQRSLSGDLAFDLALNGPVELASLAGSVRLEGGRMSDPALPVALRDIVAGAELSGGAVRVTAEAQGAAGGRLAVAGTIALRRPFAADLTGDLRNLRLRDPQLYDTRASGRLSLTGPLAGGGRIAGSVDLGQTDLRIPEAGLAGTDLLPGIRHRAEPGAVRDTRRKAGLLGGDGTGGGAGARGGAVFGLDVTVSAPNRIFLRGRGLDVELGGAVQLTGSTAAVVPAGAFELVRGRLDLLGKRLTISEARLDLQGDLVPFLRAVAATETGGETVSILVEGPATAPTVTFASASGLPEEEVLSRLLFGRGIDRISAFQAAQLAAAVAQLAGRGGEGTIGRLRRGFGLDDLDVRTDEAGNATLSAGRYLDENLYTGVEVAPGGRSRVTLNLDLPRGVTLRGGVDSDGQTGIGIYLERDY